MPPFRKHLRRPKTPLPGILHNRLNKEEGSVFGAGYEKGAGSK